MSDSVVADDIDGNSHDVDRGEVTWRPSVYGIVIDSGKILLSPQHGENKFDLPGGGVEIHERLEEALLREVKEETGIDVRVKRFLTLRENFFKVTFREPQDTWHSIMAYYLCEAIGGEISTDGFDDNEKTYAREAVWVDIDTLDSIEIAASYDWRELVREHLTD